MNLIEFFKNLFRNPEEAAKFQADPQSYLQDKGVTDASYEELNEAVVIACSEPVSQGAQVATGGSAANQGGGQASAASLASSPTSSSGPAPTNYGAAPTAPPPPPPDMPPAEMVQEVVNHYVTQVHEANTYVTNNETTVYDDDTNVDNSVTNLVNAEEGAIVAIDNDNDATTASGEGSAAFGEDSDIDGFAQGDGAVAAGESIDAPVNTGTNEGIINDDGTVLLENSPIGDNNTVVDEGILGDSNIQSQGSGVAAGGDVNVTNVDVAEGATVEDSNFGVGITSSDDDIVINDNDGIDVDDNDGIDVDLLSDQDLIDVDLGAGAFRDSRALASASDSAELLRAAQTGVTNGTGDPAPKAAVADELDQVVQIEEPPPVEDFSRQAVAEQVDVMLEPTDSEMVELD